jgi:hypothetical protein
VTFSVSIPTTSRPGLLSERREGGPDQEPHRHTSGTPGGARGAVSRRPAEPAAGAQLALTLGMISSVSRLRSSMVLAVGTSRNGGHSSGIVIPASL